MIVEANRTAAIHQRRWGIARRSETEVTAGFILRDAEIAPSVSGLTYQCFRSSSNVSRENTYSHEELSRILSAEPDPRENQDWRIVSSSKQKKANDNKIQFWLSRGIL